MVELAFIIAMAVLFLHATTWEGMIFQKVPEWLWDVPVWMKKPLYSCPVCMSFWWGVFIIVAGELFHVWPCIGAFKEFLTLFVAGGINVIASSFLKPDPDGHNSGGVQQ